MSPDEKIDRRTAVRLLGAGVLALPAARLGADAPTPEMTSVPTMHSRLIPSSKESLPVIGLGTWQTFDIGASSSERAPREEVLRAFVELGGKLIDSSPMYGRSEEVVGDLAVKLGLQAKLFLATKVWTSGKAAGIEQMEDSMKKLRTPKLDLMQVHNLVDVKTHLGTLQEWKRSGRIRYLGITHYHAGGHDAVAQLIQSESLDFVQINYSVAERDAEHRLLPIAKDSGVAVIVNRPFAGGELLRDLRTKPLPTWAGDIQCSSWSQLLLKFVISHPAVTCAIPATSKVEHLRDNVQAGLGPLPDQALRTKIARLF